MFRAKRFLAVNTSRLRKSYGTSIVSNNSRSRGGGVLSDLRSSRSISSFASQSHRNKDDYRSRMSSEYVAAAVLTAAVIATTAATKSKAKCSEHRSKNNHQNSIRYEISNAAEKAASSVVNIMCGSSNTDIMWGFGGTLISGGSGFIIDHTGIIVTNAHVVNATSGPVTITLPTGVKLPAKVFAMDVQSDIALLKADPRGAVLPVATLGSSALLRPGEWVVAVGSPLFLSNSVTAGIVSALARPGSDMGLRHRLDYIQTDAAINAGNSGGPLLNLDGEVIGINTFKAANSDGISFSIPIDTAKEVIRQLLIHKRVIRPYIGLNMAVVRRAAYDPDFDPTQEADGDERAVLAVAVQPHSPCEKAGLQPYDLILEFGGTRAHSTKDILSHLGLEVGKKIDIVVKRQGVKDPIKLYVVTEPEKTSMPARLQG